jgi:Fe-S cluster biogenesis protein NfuA
VANDKKFQEQIRQLGTLVGELDQMPAGAPKTAARELIQLLMEVHGTGLERIMEIVFATGEAGEAIIGKLGQDPIVRNLLLLYSLHPEDLETRVLKALDAAGSRLRKHDATVELVSIQKGVVQLRLQTTGHACGSTTRNLRSIVEESISDLVPDLTSLTILSSEDESTSGFVSLDYLLKHPYAAPALTTRGAEVEGSD